MYFGEAKHQAHPYWYSKAAGARNWRGQNLLVLFTLDSACRLQIPCKRAGRIIYLLSPSTKKLLRSSLIQLYCSTKTRISALLESVRSSQVWSHACSDWTWAQIMRLAGELLGAVEAAQCLKLHATTGTTRAGYVLGITNDDFKASVMERLRGVEALTLTLMITRGRSPRYLRAQAYTCCHRTSKYLYKHYFPRLRLRSGINVTKLTRLQCQRQVTHVKLLFLKEKMWNSS